MNWVYVFLGGGLGSLARFFFSIRLNVTDKPFPYGTLASNLVSCLLLGSLYVLYSKNQVGENSRLLLMIGFCGGFSTFSTFGLEMLGMMQKGDLYTALIYIVLSNFLCILAVYMGFSLTQRLI